MPINILTNGLHWIEQFHYKKVEKLELLATIDMAVQDLLKDGLDVSTEAIKTVLQTNKEWKPKLKRAIFSDSNIAQAINESQELFG